MTRISRVARRTAAVAGVTCGGVSIAALLAACGSSGGHPGAASDTTPPASSSNTSSAPASSAASSSSPDVTSAKTQCATSGLTASVAKNPGGAAAGSVYVPVNFTNISSHTCVLYGFPGVSWVTGMRGSQIGAPATRQTGFGSVTVTLAPGGVAHAWLQIADAGNFPTSTCKPVTANWLKIYPPDQFSALYASWTAQVCSSKNTGGSSPLSVLPIRSGHGVSGQVP